MVQVRPTVVAMAVLLAGCSGVGLPTAAPTSASPVADQCNIDDLEFAEDGGAGWAEDRVVVTYTLTGTADLFLVVTEGGTPLGTRHVESDGAQAETRSTITLDEPLTGIHQIRVLAYGDLDRNDAFDKRLDHVCEAHFGAVQTTLITRNFSDLATTNATRSLLPSRSAPNLDGRTG